jgi:hypothetical protein
MHYDPSRRRAVHAQQFDATTDPATSLAHPWADYKTGFISAPTGSAITSVTPYVQLYKFGEFYPMGTAITVVAGGTPVAIPDVDGVAIKLVGDAADKLDVCLKS